MVRCFCLCGGVCVVVFALFVLLLIVWLLLFVVVGQECCIEAAKVPKNIKTTVDVVGLTCLSLGLVYVLFVVFWLLSWGLCLGVGFFVVGVLCCFVLFVLLC